MTGRELLLLDTSVVVQVCRGKEVGQRIDKAYGLRDRAERPLISVVTVGEALGLGKQARWGQIKLTALRGQARVIAEIQRRVDTWRGFTLGRAAEAYPQPVPRYQPVADDDRAVSDPTRS